MKDVTGILGLAARARKTATGEIVYTQLRARHVHLLILAAVVCLADSLPNGLMFLRVWLPEGTATAILQPHPLTA